MELQYHIPITDRKFADLNPIVAGWHRCHAGHSFGPAIRDYYLIHYVVSGCGVLENKHGSYPVKKGEIFIIKPGEVTTYSSDNKHPWHYLWMGFNGRLAGRIEELDRYVMKLDSPVFLDLFDLVSSPNGREEFLASKLFLLMSVLFAKDRKEDYVSQTIHYIDNNYMDKITIESISHMLSINRRYLSRIFKQRIGLSMQQYLIERRLQVARELIESGYNISDVACMVGYEDAFAFSKIFKKHIGHAPRIYKKVTK